MNPMMQMLNQPNLGSVRGMLNAIRSAGNPQMMLNQLASQNPMLSQALQYVRQNGGNAQAAFYKLAQERGVDPNTILSQLQ